MIKRKILGLLTAVSVLTVTLGGCGSSAKIEDYAANEDTKEITQESSGIQKEKIKVGVLYISDPEEGSGYSYTHDLGIIGMQNNLSLEEEQIVRGIVDDADEAATKKEIENMIDDGCNVIFTTSWGYMEATEEMAEKYPDVYFSHGTGYLSNGKNFTNYFGRIYQPRYLSGVVAGMNTGSNKIGYVAAQDSSNAEVTGGIDAFAMGVASVNKEAKVYVKVTNSWYSPEKEKKASEELLDMGCDVMAQHCDTGYPQTLAQEKGVYGIGYNSDMSKETPDSCLCSVIWTWSAYYTCAVQSIIDGTWDGTNYYGGMAEGVVGMTDVASFAKEGTQEKVAQVTGQILSGELNVFDGAIKTNTGEVIGQEGETLEDAVITGGIDWYYENVVIVD